MLSLRLRNLSWNLLAQNLSILYCCIHRVEGSLASGHDVLFCGNEYILYSSISVRKIYALPLLSTIKKLVLKSISLFNYAKSGNLVGMDPELKMSSSLNDSYECEISD